MKKLFYSLLSLCAFSATAQTAPVYNSAGESAQIWNLSNTYYGTPYLRKTATSTVTNLGTQLDTAATGTTKYLTVCSFAPTNSTTGTGTFAAKALPGVGGICFTFNCWKASTTATTSPTCVVTMEESNNGTNWATITGVSVFTLSPTSATAAVSNSVHITAANKLSKYYRSKMVTGTDSVSFRADYNYTYLKSCIGL